MPLFWKFDDERRIELAVDRRQLHGPGPPRLRHASPLPFLAVMK